MIERFRPWCSRPWWNLEKVAMSNCPPNTEHNPGVSIAHLGTSHFHAFTYGHASTHPSMPLMLSWMREEDIPGFVYVIMGLLFSGHWSLSRKCKDPLQKNDKGKVNHRHVCAKTWNVCWVGFSMEKRGRWLGGKENGKKEFYGIFPWWGYVLHFGIITFLHLH